MALSDEDLVRKCLNGEDSAYGFLVDKYKGAVHTLARKKLSNHHDAEEVAQEAFLKAYQNLPSLKEPNRFAGWLYVITANECCRRLKKRTREKVGLLSVKEIMYQTQSDYTAQQTKQQLRDSVDALPESDRTVIHLHYFGGLTCEEIGRFLGTSKNAVKMRLSRARKKLKEEMTQMLEQVESTKQIPMQFTLRIMERLPRLFPLPPTYIRPNPFSRIIPAGALLLSALLVVIGWGISGQTTSIPPTSWEGTREIDVPIELLNLTPSGEEMKIGGATQASGQSLDQIGITKPSSAQSGGKSVGLSALAAENREKVSVSGTVIADGKPVPNAQVAVCGRQTKVAETVTDANGRFVFEALPLKRGDILIAHAPGYAIEWYPQSNLSKPLQDVQQDIQIQLGESIEHRGVVKDAQGKPIEGAQVQVAVLSKGEGNSILLSREMGYGFARTNSKGNFSIPNLPKKSGVYLYIDHPDYALQRQRTIPVEKQMTFHLTKGGSIRGKVYFKETGKSPKPLTVLACANVRDHDTPPPRQEVRTDVDGNFVFAHILPGSYYLLLPERVSGWTFVAPAVKVEEGKEISGADFMLTKGGLVHGSVLYKGKPMAGVDIRIFDDSEPSLSEAGKAIYIKTDEKGAYQVQVAPGEVRLAVSAPKGYKDSQRIPNTLIVKEGEEVWEVNFELIERPLVTVRGKVQTKNGTPVPNATVLGPGIPNLTTKTDENGEFAFEEIEEEAVLMLVASLPQAGLKGKMTTLVTKDTQMTITLAPVDDKSARSAVLAQDILEATQKYRNLILRRKRWSKGGRRNDEPTGKEEGKQYRQGYFQLQELLVDYYDLTHDKAAYLPDGWIYELTLGMVTFRFKPDPEGRADMFGIGPSNELLRE